MGGAGSVAGSLIASASDSAAAASRTRNAERLLDAPASHADGNPRREARITGRNARPGRRWLAAASRQQSRHVPRARLRQLGVRRSHLRRCGRRSGWARRSSALPAGSTAFLGQPRQRGARNAPGSVRLPDRHARARVSSRGVRPDRDRGEHELLASNVMRPGRARSSRPSAARRRCRQVHRRWRSATRPRWGSGRQRSRCAPRDRSPGRRAARCSRWRSLSGIAARELQQRSSAARITSSP